MAILWKERNVNLHFTCQYVGSCRVDSREINNISFSGKKNFKKWSYYIFLHIYCLKSWVYKQRIHEVSLSKQKLKMSVLRIELYLKQVLSATKYFQYLCRSICNSLESVFSFSHFFLLSFCTFYSEHPINRFASVGWKLSFALPPIHTFITHVHPHLVYGRLSYICIWKSLKICETFP